MDNSEERFIPLMKLGTCLFVSVPSSLRDSEARSLQDSIVTRLSNQSGIQGLVLDVSALAFVDSFAAKILGDTSSMARSYGAKTVLVGIRPAIATTLVELGIGLETVETAMNLERALKKLKLKIVSE